MKTSVLKMFSMKSPRNSRIPVDIWVQEPTGETAPFHRLEDLGLKQFTVAELFTRIFIPTSFLLVCILHLHYFHDRFLELTDLKSIPSKEDSAVYR